MGIKNEKISGNRTNHDNVCCNGCMRKQNALPNMLPSAEDIEAVKITYGDIILEKTDLEWISALVRK